MKMCDFNPILEYIRNFHFQDDGKLTDDEIKEFHNLILQFYNSKKMYELTLNEEIMDFYFLHCASDFYCHKSYFINECLHNKDYETANTLVERMVKTLMYKDAKTIDTKNWGGNWQLDVVWTFKDLSRRYSIESSNEDILFLSGMFDSTSMYLDPYNQSEMNKSLFRIWPFVAEQNKYAIDILIDVTEYCATPRPRGFGKRAKEVACNISNSFVKLEDMGYYDTIVRILEQLRRAGENIKPYNFKYYFELFIYQCNPHTIKTVRKKKRSLLNYWLSLNPDEDSLVELEDKLG